jgi:hypothetical protein
VEGVPNAALRSLRPVADIAPTPNFLSSCGSTAYNDSITCVVPALAAINNARAAEDLPPMVLPTNWTALTAAQQLFVATNFERTVRGLAPLSSMSTALDAAAAQGAAEGRDPLVPAGFPWAGFASNWAGPAGNPLEAIYYWMYDDGPGSTNIDCSSSNPGGCWEHRQNVLFPLACTPCVMGGAWGTTASGATSVAQLIVVTGGDPTADFRWAQEQAYLQ